MVDDYVGDDSEELQNESSGNSYLVGSSDNMTDPTNLTTITNNNRAVVATEPMENPLVMPMGIVGGIVGLIILVTLLCFVYRRYRRPPARVSERRSKGRSLVSDDLGTSQNLLDGPLGFSQSAYGLEDEVDRTIIITEIPNYSEPANGMTPVNSGIHPENEPQRQPFYENHVNNVSKYRTGGILHDVKTKTDRVDPTSLSCPDIRRKELEGKFRFGASCSDSLIADCCSSNAVSDKQEQVSEEKTKSETRLHPTTSVSKGLCDACIIDKDNTSDIPPPSPCNSETKRDYVNVPKGTAKQTEAGTEKDSLHSYVNISDETEGCPVYINPNKYKKEYKNISCSEVVDKKTKEDKFELCEMEKEETNKEYVNVAGQLNKPPSYDEATASEDQDEGLQSCSGSMTVHMSEYVNVPNQQPKVEKNFPMNNKTRPLVKLNLPKRCSSHKHTSFSESDMYLPMDYAAQQEDEYVPVGSPGTFMSYERSTFSRIPHNKKLISGSKSEDALYFGSYVNTRSPTIPVRSGSCDSVYSYADPEVMCSLHFIADDFVQPNKRTKSRIANRSKTFSPADSRVNPYKDGSKRNRLQVVKKETNQTDTGKFAPTKQDLKQDNCGTCTDHISKGAENIIHKVTVSKTSTSTHVTDSSSRRNSKSKIPVFTRAKQLHSEDKPKGDKIAEFPKKIVDKFSHDYVNTQSNGDKSTHDYINTPSNVDKSTHDDINTPSNVDKSTHNYINTPSNVDKSTHDDINTPSSNVDKSTHNYINTPSKVSTDRSNVRKLKGPAVLPKPKKFVHDRTAHFGFSHTGIDSRTKENIMYNGKIPLYTGSK